MTSPSLASRLGFSDDARLLIINCDDLGSSHAANIGTLRAMTYGVATSATLMVPCPWAREAATLFKGKAVGVHLTLTAELEGCRWRGLTNGKSLHDDDGFLIADRLTAMKRFDAEEARLECRAQIETALKWGVDVTHLDTHMFAVHGRQDLFEVLLDLAEEFRLPIRMLSWAMEKRFGFPAHDLATRRGVIFNDHLLSSWPRTTRDVFEGAVAGLEPGVTEIFAHPVMDGEELRAFDPLHADIRASDAQFLVDPSARTCLERHGVHRISFRELRDLQRAQ